MVERPPLKRTILPANTVLFDEGDQGDRAYVIAKGLVEINIGVHGDTARLLATRAKGDIVGEMALIDDGPRMAAAVALRETEVIEISREEFLERLKDMDPVMRKIVDVLVERLRDMGTELKKHDKVNWSGLAHLALRRRPVSGSPTPHPGPHRARGGGGGEGGARRGAVGG